MKCPNCSTEMVYKVETQNVGKYLGCTGCLGCLVSPMCFLLMPLAFFLPRRKYWLCPHCGTKRESSDK